MDEGTTVRSGRALGDALPNREKVVGWQAPTCQVLLSCVATKRRADRLVSYCLL